MIEPAHQRLSIVAQCRLLSISRSSYYYAPVPESEETLALMRFEPRRVYRRHWVVSHAAISMLSAAA